MLIQFRFKNFKSFKEDTVLDLSATRLTKNIPTESSLWEMKNYCLQLLFSEQMQAVNRM